MVAQNVLHTCEAKLEINSVQTTSVDANKCIEEIKSPKLHTYAS